MGCGCGVAELRINSQWTDEHLQKWHDTHFLTSRHNTKIVEFYPTMAAETDSYEDNANKLHP